MQLRLNHASLKQMATRHLKHVKASAYRSRLLTYLSNYLEHVLHEFENKSHTLEELLELEHTLEAIEASLIHLWVFVPYNEALYIPKRLNPDHLTRIHLVIKKGKSLGKPLKLAYSKAA
ncbi:hypothetical protein K1X76_01545 [bacterium]|nr:hypothetical protein [bacterium]